MGWAFETGYVQRNQNGTPNDLDDDTYTINFNGSSSLVLKDSSGKYHTTDESFLRIEHVVIQAPTGGNNEISYWVIWDKAGTKYYFGEDDSSQDYENRAVYQAYDYCDGNGNPVNLRKVVWRWSLNRVQDAHHDLPAEALIYRNQNESKQISSICNESWPNIWTDQAAYPVDITYPNGRYRITFVRLADRTDWDHGWYYDSPSAQNLMGKSRLKEIWVQHDADGDGDYAEHPLVRRYELSYADNLGLTPIFPNYYWSEGGRTLTLMKIEEYGLGGTGTPLPATTFTYGDDMHLTEAKNGYGGKVTFAYGEWYELDTGEDAALIQHFGAPGNPCANGDDEGGWSTPAAQCDGAGGDLLIAGTTSKGIPPGLLRPGGYYLLSATLRAISTGDSARLSLSDGSQDYDLGLLSLWVGQFQTTSGFLKLPATTNKYAAWRVKTYSHAGMSWFKAKPVVTRYRVTSKTVTDEVTGETSTVNYRYDEPAANDVAHSQAVQSSLRPDGSVNEDLLYTPVYSEFRGHGMVREESPANWAGEKLVQTTFFYQDDARRGSASVSLAGAQEYWDPFNSLDTTSIWELVNIDSPYGPTHLTGDPALLLTNGADWNGYAQRRSTAISDGEMVMTQFRLGSQAAQAVLALKSGSYVWRVHIQYNGSTHPLVARYYDGSTWSSETQLLSDVQVGRWYVLMLGVDNQQFWVRVWDRDDPGVNEDMTFTPPTAMQNKSWRFQAYVNNGSLYLDEYSEGQLYSLSETLYATAAPTQAPEAERRRCKYDNICSDLWIYWTRPAQSTGLSFEGDGQWVGRRTYYHYETGYQEGGQYGNLTQAIESYWNGSAYVDYRAAWVRYYPNNATGTYLVGLPAYSNQYRCPAGMLDGACYTAIQNLMNEPGDYASEYLTGSTLNIYDTNTNYWTPPPAGKLARVRTFVCFANSSSVCYTGYNPSWSRLLYSEASFAYDGWGNPTSTTGYTSYGVNDTFASSGARTTTTSYDADYDTYPVQMTSGGLSTSISYGNDICTGKNGFTLGVATRITDPNGVATDACYDEYARLDKIIRDGDSASSPTIDLSYNAQTAPFSGKPFWTEAKQRIEGSAYTTVRKYYNGLGQLIQTELSDAEINGSARDVLVDVFYNAAGQVEKQTAPYDEPTSSSFHGRDPSQAYNALARYDVLGRPTLTRAFDNNAQTYTYSDGYASGEPYLERCVTDARGNAACSRADIWGRTVAVNAPSDPDVSYAYDAANRLIQVTLNTLITELTYDYAGRKISMNDPDMGPWSYTYDALGNLTRQTDAKGQRICLYYDSLNRLTGKQ